MELNKANLLQSLRTWAVSIWKFMAEYYGNRFVEVPGLNGQGKVIVPFDFSILKEIPFTVELDVGASSYWSEIASMQTLDNLLMQGKISTVEYLKRIPAGQITDRETLIAVLEEQERMEKAMAGITVPDGGAQQTSVPGAMDEAGTACRRWSRIRGLAEKNQSDRRSAEGGIRNVSA